MCTSGTVAKVLDIVGMAGMPDYSKMWGAGIGVDFNHEGLLAKGVLTPLPTRSSDFPSTST